MYDKFYMENIGERHTDGDASESGIIKFFEQIQSIEEVRIDYPQHNINNKDVKIPFNSKLKFACYIRRAPIPGTDRYTFWLAFKVYFILIL